MLCNQSTSVKILLQTPVLFQFFFRSFWWDLSKWKKIDMKKLSLKMIMINATTWKFILERLQDLQARIRKKRSKEEKREERKVERERHKREAYWFRIPKSDIRYPNSGQYVISISDIRFPEVNFTSDEVNMKPILHQSPLRGAHYIFWNEGSLQIFTPYL